MFCSTLSFPVQGQESGWLKTEIDKIIRFDTEINYREVPGFIIGIIDGDSTYFLSYGRREFSNESGPINKHDVFEIGSVSKLYTAQIVKILESEGRLSCDEKVNTYIPEKYKNPRLDKLTIQELINHQSGFSLRPEMFGAREQDSQNPYLYYTRENLLEYYRDFIPEKTGFIYSHTNYAMLEEVIQKVTGLDFNDALTTCLSTPNQLQNTFTDFPEQKQNYIAPGYDKSGTLVNPWTFSSFRASEGIKTSPEDAMLFLQSLLNQNSIDTAGINVFSSGENKQDKSFNRHLYLENGWHIIPVKGKKVRIHTGRTSGHNCFMGMVKETKTAVVVMSNSWVGTGDLGLQILRLINQNWKF